MTNILDYATPVPKSHAPLAVAMLIVCCLMWGWSFPTMQIVSRAFDSHTHARDSIDLLASRALFNGFRFGLAGLLYLLLTLGHHRSFSRADILGGMAVGASFGIAMLFQILGLTWARPSVSGFLTALAVVFAPLAQALVLRRAVGPAAWLAVALAFLGMVLFSWPNPAAGAANTLVTTPPLPLLGECLTVLASMIFTVQILSLDHYGQSAHPVRLTSIMFLTTSVISLFVAGVLSRGGMFRPSLLAGLAGDRTVWWVMSTLVLFSSVGAMHLMNTFQPRVSPAIASVVYCSEPLFATLFSLAFGAEQLTFLTILGGVTVLAAVLIVAIKPASPTAPH
ncbi:MAG: DMT family transporter [Tepidisphaeraceae bacterium]|jgi:drug/metabolite transporter (DMT)-like permease